MKPALLIAALCALAVTPVAHAQTTTTAPAAATPSVGTLMMGCTQTADRAAAIAACTGLIKAAGKDTATLSTAYMARAAAAKGNGDLKGAFNDLSSALYADPKNAGIWLKRGDIRAALGQKIRSAADYSIALKYDPKNINALLGRGEQYRLLGVLPKAIEDATAAIKLDPKSAAAFANRAYASQRYGKNDDAIKDADEAIKLDTKSAIAYAARGLARTATDKIAAITDLKRALELDPKLAAATDALKKLVN